MAYHRKPDAYYKLILPVKVWYSWREKYWRLLDKHDVIIADKLTKEFAETLMQAVNYCGPAIDFTKLFVECECIITNREDAHTDDIMYRNKMRNQAAAFLVELGVIAPPLKYIDALPVWRDQLMKDFYEKAYKYE